MCIWGNQLRYPARENDLRERIPHTRPSSHEKYFQSILGSVSYCVVILRTPTYWSVRMVSCNFKLGGVNHFTADHAQQAIWPANLVLLSSTSQKISMWKNLARVASEEQNGRGLWEFILFCIQWIKIYLVDSAIHLFSNWGHVSKRAV